MKRISFEISISKEELRIVNAAGQTASCWVKLGWTVQPETGDTTQSMAEQIREEFQPIVDDWLLRQGGYVVPPDEEGMNQETLPEFEDQDAIRAHLAGAFGPKIKVEVSELPINGDAAGGDQVDEIPL